MLFPARTEPGREPRSTQPPTWNPGKPTSRTTTPGTSVSTVPVSAGSTRPITHGSGTRWAWPRKPRIRSVFQPRRSKRCAPGSTVFTPGPSSVSARTAGTRDIRTGRSASPCTNQAGEDVPGRSAVFLPEGGQLAFYPEGPAVGCGQGGRGPRPGSFPRMERSQALPEPGTLPLPLRTGLRARLLSRRERAHRRGDSSVHRGHRAAPSGEPFALLQIGMKETVKTLSWIAGYQLRKVVWHRILTRP